jgi:hypothetical protein
MCGSGNIDRAQMCQGAVGRCKVSSCNILFLVYYYLGRGCPVRRGIATLGSGRCTSGAGTATAGMRLHKFTACTPTSHIFILV